MGCLAVVLNPSTNLHSFAVASVLFVMHFAYANSFLLSQIKKHRMERKPDEEIRDPNMFIAMIVQKQSKKLPNKKAKHMIQNPV